MVWTFSWERVNPYRKSSVFHIRGKSTHTWDCMAKVSIHRAHSKPHQNLYSHIFPSFVMQWLMQLSLWILKLGQAIYNILRLQQQQQRWRRCPRHRHSAFSMSVWLHRPQMRVMLVFMQTAFTLLLELRSNALDAYSNSFGSRETVNSLSHLKSQRNDCAFKQTRKPVEKPQNRLLIIDFIGAIFQILCIFKIRKLLTQSSNAWNIVNCS